MSDNPEPEINALKSDLERMREEFASLKDKLARKLADGASSVADAIDSELSDGHLASRLADLEKQFEATAGRMKREAVNRIESEVSLRPLTSLAVAFAVGLVAAQLLRR